MIEGVLVTPLKKINHPKGDIYHGLKSSDSGFEQFGESYFSTVHQGDTKGWKQHKQMLMNLIVPVGSIRFVIYDPRESSATFKQFFDITIGDCNYARLTVPSGVWLAFSGVSANLNLLNNIASIEHQPEEAINIPLDEIAYSW